MKPEIFPRRVLRVLVENTSAQYSRLNRPDNRIVRCARTFTDWSSEHKGAFFGIVLVGNALIMVVLMLPEWLREADIGQDPSMTRSLHVSVWISRIIFLLAIASALLPAATAKVLSFALLAFPWLVLLTVRAVRGLLSLVGQSILLVPLSLTSFLTRSIPRRQRIRFICPSPECGYQGLPAYVCPECGQANDKLWPNLYGPLWHYCVGCDHRLPALDLLGRKHLQRCCASCHTPLAGRHFGRAPERIVPIVGGARSAGLSYLHMTVGAMVGNSHADDPVPIKGEIDDPVQANLFQRAWDRFSMGLTPAMTTEIAPVFLMHVALGDEPCQLYLYNACGLDSTSTSLTSRMGQPYFHLAEGFIVVADALSLEAAGGQAGSKTGAVLMDAVNSVLAPCLSGGSPGKSGKFDKRVAVVFWQADPAAGSLSPGDSRQGHLSAHACRQALIDGGAGHAVRALEGHFQHIEYFACSPPQPRAEASSTELFQDTGLLEPLHWILKGSPRKRVCTQVGRADH